MSLEGKKTKFKLINQCKAQTKDKRYNSVCRKYPPTPGGLYVCFVCFLFCFYCYFCFNYLKKNIFEGVGIHEKEKNHVPREQPELHVQLGYKNPLQEGRKEMFYLTTHLTHFIYGYMASDIWLRTILIVRKETGCRHIGYSFRLAARALLYAPSHRQDSTYHGLCYASRGALAGTRNNSMGP